MKQVLGSLLIILTLTTSNRLFAQVQGKFGNTQSALDVNAALEVESTSKGVLLPRLTTAQQNAMSAPANGMLIYNTDSACFVLRRAGIWRSLCAANGGEAWSTLGNSGTNVNTHFIGTTDNVPLSIKVNNQKAGRIDNTNANAFFGFLSGNVNTAANNAAFGDQTLAVNTTGFANSAFGSGALLNNTTGYVNSAFGREALTFNTTGKQNAAFGVGALKANISGDNNNAFGYQALVANTTGAYNNSFGYQNLVTNTTGSYNTSYGHTALYSSTTASYNTAVGAIAMYNNTTGSNNTAVGNEVLRNNTTAWSNAALGFRTLFNNSTGNANTAIGDSALVLNTTGANNIGIGYQAGSSITTGSNNIAIGLSAQVPTATANNQLSIGNWIYGVSGLIGINTTTPQYKLDIDGITGSTGNPLRLLGLNAGATSDSIISSNSGVLRRLSINQILGNAWNITGNAGTVDGTNFIGTTDNIPFNIRVNNQRSGYIGVTGSTFFGYQAGLVTTGTKNTFIGSQTGTANTTGGQNVAVGELAFNSNTTGTLNTAVGQDAMRLNLTGNQNTALGESALEANITGDLNVALGHEALTFNTAGSFNVAIGSQSLYSNVNANRNLGIGYLSLYTQSYNNGGTSWDSDNMAIGYQALYNNQPTTTTNGYRNIAIGFQSLLVNTTGLGNVALGYQSGNILTTGSNNTLLGYQANVASATLTNATAIGSNAIVGASNSLVLGNAVNVGINTQTPQYKLDINAQTGSSGNPLRLQGLNAGATSDSILSSASGVLRRLSINQVLANAWNITGNSGTTAGTNFIGTTDGQSLAFKTANTEWMRLNTTGSLGIGTTAPVYKVHVEEPGGYNADIAARLYNTNNLTYQPSLLLQASGGTKAAATAVAVNTTLGVIRWGGYDGSAFNDVQAAEIGATATEAFSTTAHGTSLGFKTIPNTTTTALTRMTISQNGNVGIGTAAPSQQLEITAAMRMPATTSSTTGVIYKGANPFIHDYKPAANDGNNTFVGINAGNFTMTSTTSWLASGNTGVGVNTLTALTDGGYNTAVGRGALTINTTGSYNTALGNSALAANIVGVANTAVGNNALATNTGSSNTAVGNAALYLNTSGAANTAVGESSLNKNTTGTQNTAVGQSSMRDNVGGSYNTAVGLSALQANTSGVNNVAVGVSALVLNLTGGSNVAVGYDALSATTSSNNVSVGFGGGLGTTSGGNNTFIGYQTGSTNVTGANNTFLGYQANVTSGALSNVTAIGNGATVDVSNKIRLGNASVTKVETYGSFTTISDKRLKTNINDNFIGLDFIKAVRPVKYELKAQKGIVYDGFIAQEVDLVLTKLNIKSFSGVSKPENTEGGYYTVSYSTFVVPLVNAVKELDALSEKLKVKSDKLAAENEVLKAELEKMKKDNSVLKASVDKNSQDIEAIKAALIKKQN